MGFIIKYFCPDEWKILTMDKVKITADFIENLAYISNNKWMRTDDFHQALIDFRQNGYNTKTPIKYTAEIALRVIQKKRDSQ